MSRRSLDLLMGSVILLILAVKATEVVLCGLIYTWWMARRTTGEVAVGAVARDAMIGGFVGRMLLTLLLFLVFPLAAGARALEFTGAVLFNDASRTGLGLFWVGLLALFQSFFLGLSVRLMGPSLPR